MARTRATVRQNTYLGVERTPGVAVQAVRRLQTQSVTVAREYETDSFRPQGAKFVSATWIKKISSKVSGDGVLDYNETGFILASAISRPVTTDNGDGTFTHVFTAANTSADNPVSYTIETGDEQEAQSCAFCMITQVGFDFSRDASKVTFEGWAQEGKPVTITEDPLEIDPEVVIPTSWTNFISRVPGEQGDKLSSNFKATWSLSGRYNPKYVLDAANPGYTDVVEVAPEFTGTMAVESDDQGLSYLADLKAGKTLYMTSESVGAAPDNPNSRPCKLIIESCFKPTGVSPPSDEDGVQALEFAFTGVYDKTLKRAMRITLVNHVDTYDVIPEEVEDEDETP